MKTALESAPGLPVPAGATVSLAHHWLVGMRGGEKVLEQMCMLFPRADIYTLVSNPENLSGSIRSHRIINSPLQRFGVHRYKSLLPFFPAALRRLRVNGAAELLFSSDASVVKGLTLRPDMPHVCYCHSPPRYLWDLQETYLQKTGGLGAAGRAVFRAVIPSLRRFDYDAAQRVTHFISNSEFVRARIRKNYGRESEVIHPPVEVDAFTSRRPAEDFYLIVTELVAYKRVEVAIDAFNQLGKRLVIIGDGAEATSLRSRAKSNIEFLGRQPFSILKDHFERCRAFIYPQIEDFGITAVEAQAAGRPVIALRQGGALDSVVEDETGIFFEEQTAASLAEAVRAFERQSFRAEICRKNAERFRPENFRAKIKVFLRARLPRYFADYLFPV